MYGVRERGIRLPVIAAVTMSFFMVGDLTGFRFKFVEEAKKARIRSASDRGESFFEA